jgi:hypothetical protein
MEQSVNQPLVSHDIISAGVDWITATTSKGSSRWDMQEYADNQRRRFMDSAETIKQGYRLGYYGWQAEGFFHGSREGGSIIVASGAQAHNVFPAVAHLADNISRLDLQVTIATPDERPHLGVQAYSTVKSGAPCKRRVKNVTLITSYPQGETCSIGKRSSDQYGRIYDKATESGQGEPRTAWRYEVELKRSPAVSLAARLRGDQMVESSTLGFVHDWYSARGVIPVFTPDVSFCPQKPVVTGTGREVLTWFEESLSITVGKAVRRYGVERVFESLHLTPYLDVKWKEDKQHASGSRRSG